MAGIDWVIMGYIVGELSLRIALEIVQLLKYAGMEILSGHIRVTLKTN